MALRACEYAVPTVPAAREVVLMLKTGAVIVKDTGFDRTPAGFSTVTGKNPGACTRFNGTAAASCVALPKVVARAIPFHATTDPATEIRPGDVHAESAAARCNCIRI